MNRRAAGGMVVISWGVVALLVLSSTMIEGSLTSDQVLAMIHQGTRNAYSMIQDPLSTASYLGTMLVSQWFVMAHVTGHQNLTKINSTALRDVILSQQFPDGSWLPVYDANVKTGTPEATLWNYLALKVIGEDDFATNPRMLAARNWMRAKGGLESLNQMHKLFMALLGNYPWNKFRSVPLFIFKNTGMLKHVYIRNYVGQWVYPHLMPMAYLIKYQPTHHLGSEFDVSELGRPSSTSAASDYLPPPPLVAADGADDETATLMKEMFELQQPHGSFGTYATATILSMISLQDFTRRFGGASSLGAEIPDRVSRGFQFVDELYSIPGYLGTPDWGMWWDHALLGIAMRDGGASVDKTDRFADEVLAAQQPNGGIPYGTDFEYAPDVDDSAEVAIWFSKMGPKYQQPMNRIISWLFTMQNSDGGWGAFDHEHTGSGVLGWMIDLLAHQFAGSAEIFDPSEADVTSHILEALGMIGYKTDNQPVQNAISFIKKKQTNEGIWKGRWAINYVYCTGTVLIGLARVNQNMNEAWIAKAVAWLVAHQNADGGWGETSESYTNPKLAGMGISTASQTAWAVMGLMEAEKAGGYKVMQSINRGMDFLYNNFNQTGSWTDASCVGTGHPGLVYMQYPAYPHSWPLMAVSRYFKYYIGAVPPVDL